MRKSPALLLVAATLVLVRPARAQIFLGPSTFSIAPSSTMGPFASTLTLTDIPNGFVVSGQHQVTIPATVAAAAHALRRRR